MSQEEKVPTDEWFRRLATWRMGVEEGEKQALMVQQEQSLVRMGVEQGEKQALMVQQEQSLVVHDKRRLRQKRMVNGMLFLGALGAYFVGSTWLDVFYLCLWARMVCYFVAVFEEDEAGAL
ncbi:hypothetical protein QBC39DRAFT_367690 [Podospora conica]|nr:hypothetical protein QBC39DRAFT_367690 [Schizothecium conicum]